MEVVAGSERHGVMKRHTQITVRLSGHSQQHVGDGVTCESAIEIERAAAERSEKGIEQEAPDIETEFHGVLARDEGQVLDVVVRVVVPALG